MPCGRGLCRLSHFLFSGGPEPDCDWGQHAGRLVANVLLLFSGASHVLSGGGGVFIRLFVFDEAPEAEEQKMQGLSP